MAPGTASEFQGHISNIFIGLPNLFGNPIYFELRPRLTAHRGKLLSGSDLGAPVHAAAFIRKRVVVLETDLFSQPDRLRLILTHEIFHFAWVRLNNSQRCGFADLLAKERQSRAKGEIGESAGVKKQRLQERLSLNPSSRLWREYVCESFCDSAAALFSGVAANEHFTLAQRWAGRRYQWLLCAGEQGWKC